MSIVFNNAAIEKKTAFAERVKYDAGNNRLSAQFDGLGGISKYAVMNKFSIFSQFYTLFSFDGTAFDLSGEKTVKMIGRKQEVSFETDKASLLVVHFLDDKTNAIYTQVEVTAKVSHKFDLTVNFGTDFLSYVQQLLANRLSVKNIARIIGGFLKPKRKGLSQPKAGVYLLKGDVLGDFYIDFAFNTKPAGLESERGYFNQWTLGDSVDAGEKKVFRFVVSAGTRQDDTCADVAKCMESFDAAQNEAENYNRFLKTSAEAAADSAKSAVASLSNGDMCAEMLKSYHASNLNCVLSSYKEIGKFKALIAGIVYQFPARTYFRDSYWSVLPLLSTKPELVKNQILTLARGINKKDGSCPSAVKYNFKNYWGDHSDSPSFLAIMVHDYIAATGDTGILNEKVAGTSIFDLAQKVVVKLSEKCDKTGLLQKSGEYNRRDWCDNVFRTGYVTYDEALYARALYAVSRFAKILNMPEQATEFFKKYMQVKASINELLWDEEKGWFVNYRDGEFVEDNLSIDIIPIILYGLCDEARTKRVLENMEKLLESKNNPSVAGVAGDFGTLAAYPFYKRASAVVQKSSLPYYYHNGGDWPYLSNMYAYAKYINGLDGGYPLTRWFLYNLEKGNYTPVEFFSPLHPEGSLLQAWSGDGAFVLSNLGENFFAKDISKLKLK